MVGFVRVWLFTMLVSVADSDGDPCSEMQAARSNELAPISTLCKLAGTTAPEQCDSPCAEKLVPYVLQSRTPAVSGCDWFEKLEDQDDKRYNRAQNNQSKVSEIKILENNNDDI